MKVKLRGDLKELAEQVTKENKKYTDKIAQKLICTPVPFEVGKTYLIRTITMIDIGRVKAVVGQFIVLTEASWIGDTGRFNECLQRNDVFNEIEPFKHDVYLNWNTIVDATDWPFALPKTPK